MAIRLNRAHRLIGIVLLLPIFGWALTGLVFFVKPGYAGAYEMLSVRTYPLDATATVAPQPTWLEYRYLRTVLGDHVIARTSAGWLNLDPHSMQQRPAPSEAQVRQVVNDAFAANPQRYGQITSVTDAVARTDTGVEVTLDWKQMKLQQHGGDTALIDLLYRIHYLQWTGVGAVDKMVGLLGLALLILTAIFGATLAFRKR
jgi:hypothetical protein